MSNPSLMVTRCAGILLRSTTHSSYSQPFDRLPADTQHYLVDAGRLCTGEDPCIAYFSAVDLWTLVTTQRLIWCDKGNVQYVYWEEVRDATPNDDQSLLLNPEHKLQRDRLTIITTNNQQYEVKLDPVTFHPFWKAIIAMIITHRHS